MLEKQNKYSIRKLTVGAASVLIGASFFAVNGKTVKADTVTVGKAKQKMVSIN